MGAIFTVPCAGATIKSTSNQTPEIQCKLSGKVIRISDGDTIKILDAQNRSHKVRLAGIDAPEKRQAFGNVAKIFLSHLVKHETVCVNWDKRGKYGRIIGKVYVRDIDVNLALLENGLAWHYKKYQKDQIKQDRHLYAAAELRAKQKYLGLWRDDKAIAPWAWRRQKRQAWKAQKSPHNPNQISL